MPAGIFHTVCGDDEDGMLRPVLLPGVLVDVADVVDGTADGFDEGSAAAHVILPVRHRLNLPEIHPVMDDSAFVGKQNRGNQGFPFLLFLLFDHSVETSDSIRLQPGHRAAFVEDKDQFCQILFHKNPLLFVSGQGFLNPACRSYRKQEGKRSPAGRQISPCRNPAEAYHIGKELC